ncbi:MAG: hydantoinase B/oxoprolinase family protein [Chloroflexota bacterium]|nr:hydantoinase B/oxoprolinase family protein [Chloroflexota bacterium]MDE2885648.1 hydantoinase B/oxoprolinase family protein [Chloroflexota bacterium]
MTFEILSHRLHQIAKEMGTTLERVGGTVNTTQQHDYMASLYRPNGDILATGESMPWHVACGGFTVKRILERFEDREGVNPGDVFLLNDPYISAIHQSDLYMVTPHHYEGQLISWSASFVHVMDIGAMSPGGNSPNATEICQEGVRIPGVKLVDGGTFRQDLFEMIIGMTRQPMMVGLDLKSELAGNNVAKQRMQEMVAQYGWELIDAVSQEMIRHSEQVLRRRISEIPDGEWNAETSITTGPDSASRFIMTLRKRGDTLIFDYTGSDKQARTGINLPYHATFGSCYDAVIATMAYDLPKNHGLFLPIEVIAEPGSVVHVEYPAPVSLNTTSGGAAAKYVARSAMLEMLAGVDKWRSEVMGLNSGSRLVRTAGTNQRGVAFVSGLAQGAVSGDGARATRDGNDSGGGGFMSVPNVEWAERNFPLLFLYRRHLKDGGGPGKYRGGAGAELALTSHDSPEGKVRAVAYGVDGFGNVGRGSAGGYPGLRSLLVLAEGTNLKGQMAEGKYPQEMSELAGPKRLLPYCDFEINDGDVLFYRLASGGGYGDPLERDPEKVFNDVQCEIVSTESAKDMYGVVIDDSLESVNQNATAKLRGKMKAERLKGAHESTGK